MTRTDRILDMVRECPSAYEPKRILEGANREQVINILRQLEGLKRQLKGLLEG